MPVQPTSAPANDVTDPPAEHTQYYREVLHELIDIGRRIARGSTPETKPKPKLKPKPKQAPRPQRT